MKPLQTAGTFKTIIEEWGITKADSGAIGVSMRHRITDWWDADAKKWNTALADEHGVALEAHGCYGTVWIFKKDGSESFNGIEQLVSAIGWDGALVTFAKQPESVSVVIDVKEETYEGKKQYKASWLYPPTSDPSQRGGLSNVASAEDIQKLQDEMGARLRAAVGSKK